MEYYLYASKEKVDMLLPQIPLTEKKKVSSKIGFNLGVLTGEIATERLSLDDRINRVRAVANYINLAATVGDPGSDAPWIKGSMRAYLGHFPKAKSAVFFIGSVDNVNLVLGGSTGNLLSQVQNDDVGYGQSYLPHLVEMMHSCVRTGQFVGDIEATTDYLSKGVGDHNQPSPWFNLVDQMQEFKKEPLIEIEYLAKTLVYNDSGSHKSVLATPVYVTSK